MTNLNNLKVNDVIIRFGQVYKVFKVEEKDGELGWRTRKITQKGEKGIKEIKYEVAFVAFTI